MTSSQPTHTQLWLGLTRPRTLLSSLSAVLVAIFYAAFIGPIDPLRTALLLVVAISAQIGSNIANDLIDFKKGADTEERTGPLRPLSKGLLTEGEVRRALYISLFVFLASGITLVALTSWWVGCRAGHLCLLGRALSALLSRSGRFGGADLLRLGTCGDELLYSTRDDR